MNQPYETTNLRFGWFWMSNARVYEVRWPDKTLTYHLVGLKISNFSTQNFNEVPHVSNMMQKFDFERKIMTTISNKYNIMSFNKDPYEMKESLELWYHWTTSHNTVCSTNVTDKFNMYPTI